MSLLRPPAVRVLPWLLVVLTLLSATVAGVLMARRWQIHSEALAVERAVLASVNRMLLATDSSLTVDAWLQQDHSRVLQTLAPDAQWRARQWLGELAMARRQPDAARALLQPLGSATAPASMDPAAHAHTLCVLASLQNDDAALRSSLYSAALQRADVLQGSARQTLLDCLLMQVHGALAKRSVGPNLLAIMTRAETELEALASVLEPQALRALGSRVLYTRAVVMDHTGDLEAASLAYQAVLALDLDAGVRTGSDHAAVLAAYASVLQRSGLWRAATQHYAAAHQALGAPLASTDTLQWAQVLVWLERPQAALDTLQPLLAREPTQPPLARSEALRLQAEALGQLQQWRAAQTTAAQAVDALSPEPEHDFQRSRVQLSQARIALAAQGPTATDQFLLPALAWGQRTEISSLHPQILLVQAQVELAAGDPGAALRAADRAEQQLAKQLAPGHPLRLIAQQVLARSQIQAGDAQAAHRVLAQTRVELDALADPDSPLWRTQLELESALPANRP